jgi:ketosteroid isomerase-like protein
MRFISLLLAVAVFCTASCSRGKKDESPEALLEAARRAHDEYVQAINSNKLDAWMSALADDIVYFVPNRGVIVGKSDVSAWLAEYLSESTTPWAKPLDDMTVSGDWAIGRYSYTATDTAIVTDTSVDGGGSTSDAGWGLIVYHRNSDGAWQVARDAWGSSRPPR